MVDKELLKEYDCETTMVDKELLKACTVNSWSIVPRMMLADSMIESGYEEFKAMEAFEPPTISNNLPLTYNVSSGGRGRYGDGGGSGNSSGIGSGNGNDNGRGGGHSVILGYGNGISHNDNYGFLMIVKQQWLTKNY